MVVTDTNYCSKCANTIGRNFYNKYLSSKAFIEHSFEDTLRNYLEFLGYLLPVDNTNSRFRYIT